MEHFRLADSLAYSPVIRELQRLSKSPTADVARDIVIRLEGIVDQYGHYLPAKRTHDLDLIARGLLPRVDLMVVTDLLRHDREAIREKGRQLAPPLPD